MPLEDWAGGEKAEAKKKQAPASCIKCTRENAEAKLLCKRPTPKVKLKAVKKSAAKDPKKSTSNPVKMKKVQVQEKTDVKRRKKTGRSSWFRRQLLLQGVRCREIKKDQEKFSKFLRTQDLKK